MERRRVTDLAQTLEGCIRWNASVTPDFLRKLKQELLRLEARVAELEGWSAKGRRATDKASLTV